MAYAQPQQPGNGGRQPSDPNNPFGSNHGHLGQSGFAAGTGTYDEGDEYDRNRDTYNSEEGSAGSQGRAGNDYNSAFPRLRCVTRPERGGACLCKDRSADLPPSPPVAPFLP